MATHALYDQTRSAPVTHVADDVTPEDIKAFCDYHEVQFHAMGTPPGVADKDGLGWGDTKLFRVSTISHPNKGITCSLDEVRRWKIEREDFDAEETTAKMAIVAAANRLDQEHPGLGLIAMQIVVGQAYSRLDHTTAPHFRSSPGYIEVASAQDQRFSFGTEIDRLFTSISTSEPEWQKSVWMDMLLQGVLLALPPLIRKEVLEGKDSRAIIESADALDTAPKP